VQRIKRLVKKALFSLLGKAGYSLVRKNASGPNNAVRGYINAKDILPKAEALNLNAAEYVKQVLNWNDHDNWITEISSINVPDKFRGKRIVEIGTGAGIFLNQVIQQLSPCDYESYEPSADWSAYLSARYGIISHPSNGQTLAFTKDDSVDLCFSNGVFVYIPFFYTVRYWLEIIRVLRPGGYLIFDVFTEECMSGEYIKKWTASTDNDYPVLIPEKTVKDFFAGNNFKLVHTFFNGFGAGVCKYFVFELQSKSEMNDR
jgi:SAM-dependent methyltransferase